METLYDEIWCPNRLGDNLCYFQSYQFSQTEKIHYKMIETDQNQLASFETTESQQHIFTPPAEPL